MLPGLAQGLAMLLALCFLYGVLLRLCRQRPRLEPWLSGLLFGVGGAFGMWVPLALVSGGQLETSTVVLSMAALVGGLRVAAVSVALVVLLHAWLGGASGADIWLIAGSGSLGLLYRALHRRWGVPAGPLALLIFGLLMHLLQLAFMHRQAPGLADVPGWPQALAFALVPAAATALFGWLLQGLRQQRHVEQTLALSHARLRDSEQRLRLLLNNLPSISVQGYRPDGTTFYWNKASAQLYGYSAKEAMGRSLLDLIIPEPMHAGVRAAMAEMFATDVPIPAGELRLRKKDGSPVDVFSSHALVKVPGQPAELYCLDIDLTARNAAEERARFLALYDPLTRLPNRRLFGDRVQQALASASRTGMGLAVLMLDLDHFKNLNDSLGHEHGDALLQAVARRVQDCVSAQDSVARLGGDEFVVLLHNLDGDPIEAAAQVRRYGDRILGTLRAQLRIEDQICHLTASMGAVMAGAGATTVDELLRRAELAMYRAKEEGRDVLSFFDPLMQTAVDRRVFLQTEMHLGLQRGQFVLYLQPQVDAGAGIIGAEVLLRWQHPEKGLIPPGEFIPLAEETGLIRPLGHWVLASTLRLQAQWQGNPQLAGIRLAVNVSARQFRKEGFVEELRELLRETGADPRRIKLELTESLLLQDVDGIIVIMQALRGMGIGLALDDFGTGYSSLGYLRRLPLDELKIDQGFVRNVLDEPRDAAIAHSIITLAQRLGMDVIAEGVETEAHHRFLLAHGCLGFQGYLFGRPVPADEFSRRVGGQAAEGVADAGDGDEVAISASK